MDKETVINYLIQKFKKIKRKKETDIKISKEDKRTIPLYFITNYLSVNKYFSTLSVFIEEAQVNIREIQNEYLDKLKTLDFSLGYLFELKTTDFFLKANAFSILEDFFQKEDRKQFDHKFVQTNLIEINSEEIDYKLKKIEEKYKENELDHNQIRKETFSDLRKNRTDLETFHKLDLQFLKEKLSLKLGIEKKLNIRK